MHGIGLGGQGVRNKELRILLCDRKLVGGTSETLIRISKQIKRTQDKPKVNRWMTVEITRTKGGCS